MHPNNPSHANEATSGHGVDEDLYSRQLGAYGMETMGKLIKMQILVIGMTGTGVEVCKNLCLAGPRAITIVDDRLARNHHLGANFFLRPEDVGCPIAATIRPRLAELNDYVCVTAIPESAVTADLVATVDCVVACGRPQSEMLRLNEWCRSTSTTIPFISASAHGLTATVFCDFGEGHIVHDNDGENEKLGIIQGIVLEGDYLVVNLVEDKLNPFNPGDYVTFDEVDGMLELNGIDPLLIDTAQKYSVKIMSEGLPSALTESLHAGGGRLKQVKIPKAISHQTLAKALHDPCPHTGMLNTPDLGLFDRPPQLHLAFLAVEVFRAEHQRLPQLRDHSDAEAVCAQAKLLHSDLKCDDTKTWVPETLDEDVVRAVAFFAEADLSPMAAFAGGVAAQEVVKVTGKFMPLDQFLHLDYFIVIKKQLEAMKAQPETDTQRAELIVDDRYRDVRATLGLDIFSKLQATKLFLVGAGALGCEFLKIFSLMGMCSADSGGKLTITDMDTIENSNLNRQFLFRKKHLGQMKSDVASESAYAMNPQLRVAPTQTRVGPETENFFDDRFWEGLDVVVNALDNIESRLYVDSRCVWYGKPLVESGTLGTKCNSQIVVPGLTESYGDSRDPAEESIPLCTLKNFPYAVEHCLQWSRDTFQGVFADTPEDVALAGRDFASFESNLKSQGFPKSQIQRVQSAIDVLDLAAFPSIQKAAQIAIKLFATFHNHPLQQLLFNFPPEHVTTEGVKFWSGTKRLPTALVLDVHDPISSGFITSSVRILCNIVGYESSATDQDILAACSQVLFPPFTPDQHAKIQVEENEEEDDTNDGSDFAVELERLIGSFRSALETSKGSVSVEPEVFEKDDDSNHHIDFVHACGNLRARNYSIKECARHESKLIAGKIIPALATTTAMITGIVALELLKVFDQERPIEDYRNSFVNIAMPVWILSEPMPAKKHVNCAFDPIIGGAVIARPHGYTIWDYEEVRIPRCTIDSLIRHIEEKHDVEVSVVSSGSKMLYMSYIKSHAARREKTVLAVLEEVQALPAPSISAVSIEVSCTDKKSGDDVIIPQVKLFL